MEWISKIIEVVNSSTKLIVTIFFVSITLLFLPDEILAFFKVVEFSKEHGSYIGIAALVSGSLLLIEAVGYLWNVINRKVSSHKIKKTCMKRLEQLDASEKSVLRKFYLHGGQNTLELPIDSLAVTGLLNVDWHEDILCLNEISSYDGRVRCNMKISDLAKENLTYEMLDLPNDK